MEIGLGHHCTSFEQMSKCRLFQWLSIILYHFYWPDDIIQNIHNNFWCQTYIITVPADVQASNSSRTSAGTVLTQYNVWKHWDVCTEVKFLLYKAVVMYSLNAVSADGLAPDGARSSADTAMT